MVPTDLNALVRHALTTTRTAFYGTTFEVDLADLPPVTCRATELEHVVAALIKNAAQSVSEARSPGRSHAPTAPGQVHISTAHDGDDVVITVRDNGVGIPEEDRPHIFRPFFSTRVAGGGHGQSLSHAWSTIVDEHAGTLGFETTTDEGATFTIRLPITGRPMPSNPLAAPRPH
jgi:signal transduction histidine kinase